MGARRIKKLVAITGKYMKGGVEKNQYQACGAMFKNDEGQISLKLDSLPLGDWNGWISVYDLDEDRQENYNKGAAQARAAMAPDPEPVAPPPPAGGPEFEDDIPF